MVLLINGVPLEESPGNISQFFIQYPHFKESATSLCSVKQQVVGPISLLYVMQVNKVYFNTKSFVFDESPWSFLW
jgi:hypothetical protein